MGEKYVLYILAADNPSQKAKNIASQILQQASSSSLLSIEFKDPSAIPISDRPSWVHMPYKS
jgi:hypothetical protein